MRSIQQNLPEFQRLGIRPIAISVDTPKDSKDLSRKGAFTYPLVSDATADVIKRYGLLHQGAGIEGHDVARPAEFLIDRTGTVRWRNLTEDYRVRARAEEILSISRGIVRQ